jgi:hypothetical protein
MVIELEAVSVIGRWVEGSISISEPISGALHSVDKVGAFILFLQFSRHVGFHRVLPNQDEISYVQGQEQMFAGIMR